MSINTNPNWPILKRYDQEHIHRIAMPLGGIGTGTVSLGGRGDLRNWEIVNTPAKGFKPNNTFFALYASTSDGNTVTKCLEGLIPEMEYEGIKGCQTPNHGLPRFRRCSFAVAYPLAQVLLYDEDVPLDVRIEAFNPMIPVDVERSSIPVAVIRFVLINLGDTEVNASVCGNLENFIGTDGISGQPRDNYIEFRKQNDLSGLFMYSEGISSSAEQYGDLALTTQTCDGITYSSWASQHFRLREFWYDFSTDGQLENRSDSSQRPVGSLAVSTVVPSQSERSVTFLLTWRFPNRMAWMQSKGESFCVGNYYATRYSDAWEVATKTFQNLKQLENDTVEFVQTFCESDLPAEVKEASLFNTSTLRTQTCFRIQDGHFLGWEGCSNGSGCCPGSCTHVWGPEQATAFLYGELAKSMRDVEFNYATDENGLMSFRAKLPLSRAQEYGVAATDGQMACLMKLYRDWQLSGDDDMLRDMWQSARKLLEFAWIEKGWDADRDGVMEGCQHNTTDVEWFGPNPLCGVWYLGALRACEEMASYLGDTKFAETCRQVFESGSHRLDEDLFNGEYYEQEIRLPSNPSEVASGLYIGKLNISTAQQVYSACLTDQLIGQYMAHLCDLGYLLDKAHVQKTLQSVMRYNFKENVFNHFNFVSRGTFVMNDESTLVYGTFPRGEEPLDSCFRLPEVWDGVEYTAAVHMLYEGQVEEGLKVIRSIRERFDGAKRNPFDETECGHHYARAMVSWAAVLALIGFHYSGITKTITFSASSKPVTWFWSNGYSWGKVCQSPDEDNIQVELNVLGGSLTFSTVELQDFGISELSETKTLNAGESLKITVNRTQ